MELTTGYYVALTVLTTACVLSFVAAVMGAVSRRRMPAIEHACWVVVLLRLAVPPFVATPVSGFPIESPTAEIAVSDENVARSEAMNAFEEAERFPDSAVSMSSDPIAGSFADASGTQVPESVEPPSPPLAQSNVEPSRSTEVAAETDAVAETAIAPSVGREETPIAAVPASIRPVHILAGIWLLGSMVTLCIAIRSYRAFGRLLRLTNPASDDLREIANSVREELGLRTTPELRTLAARIPPLVWARIGRPVVVLPEELEPLQKTETRRLLIAHEFAHIRRGDHRVRWLELFALVIWWWCPLYWFARSRLRRAEETACDAVILNHWPDRAGEYAQAILDTVEYLAGARPLPQMATGGLGSLRGVKERLLAIKDQRAASSPRLQLVARSVLLVGLALSSILFVRADESSLAGETSEATEFQSEQAATPKDEIQQQTKAMLQTKRVLQRQKIEDRLDANVELELNGLTIRQSVKEVARVTGLKVVLDTKSLKAAGISDLEFVDMKLQAISLRSALKVLLTEFGLVYRVDAEQLVVTVPVAVKLKDNCRAKYSMREPVGSRVAWVGELVKPDGSSVQGLFLTDESGKSRRLLEGTLTTKPAWSRRGRFIAIAGAKSGDRAYPLLIVEVESGKIDDTGVQGAGASWSRNGRFVACSTAFVDGRATTDGVPTDGCIGLWDTKERKLKLVSPPGHSYAIAGDSSRGGAIEPKWSPNGKWIAWRQISVSNIAGKKSIDSQIWIGDGSERVWPTPRKGLRLAFAKAGSSFRWSQNSWSLSRVDPAGEINVPVADLKAEFPSVPHELMGAMTWEYLNRVDPLPYVAAGKVNRKLAATVLGRKIYVDEITAATEEKNRKVLSKKAFEAYVRKTRGKTLYELINKRIMMKYVADNGLEVSDAELKSIIKQAESRPAEIMGRRGASVTASRQRGQRNMQVCLRRWATLQWKFSGSLYKKHGGRVGITAFGGTIAWDAQNKLIEEHVKAGDIMFHLEEAEDQFRIHAQIDHFADSYPQGDRLKEILETPPYERTGRR